MEAVLFLSIVIAWYAVMRRWSALRLLALVGGTFALGWLLLDL